MSRLLVMLLAVAFSGCATFDDQEMASLRGRGVARPVVAKLDRGYPLQPRDIRELHRKRVPEPWIIRQLDDHGVDSLITRSDLASLRRAGVSPAVLAAVIRASRRFEDRYRYAPVQPWGFYDPFDPWGFYGPHPYAFGFGPQFGFGTSIVLPFDRPGLWRRGCP